MKKDCKNPLASGGEIKNVKTMSILEILNNSRFAKLNRMDKTSKTPHRNGNDFIYELFKNKL